MRIFFSKLYKVIIVEVSIMKPNKTIAGTNIQHVKQQNAGQYGTEFSTETDVQHVKQQNAKSEAKKNQ